jgi:hypothetical protein
MDGTFTVTVNMQDVIDDIFETAENDGYGHYPSKDFKQALRDDIIYHIRTQLMQELRPAAMELMRDQGQAQVVEFISGELRGIIHRKMRAGEFRSHRGGFNSFDEVIEKNLSTMNIESVIKRHIDKKAEEFAKELRARYDNVFAAKIVGKLKEQNMLAPDVAKLLLGGE